MALILEGNLARVYRICAFKLKMLESETSVLYCLKPNHRILTTQTNLRRQLIIERFYLLLQIINHYEGE